MRAGTSERRNRLVHHPRAASWAQATAARGRLTAPALVDETRTKETE